MDFTAERVMNEQAARIVQLEGELCEREGHIEELEELHQWTSVTEEYPVLDTWVLIATKNFIDIAFWTGKEWSNRVRKFPSITHWQRLPALPPPTSENNTERRR